MHGASIVGVKRVLRWQNARAERARRAARAATEECHCFRPLQAIFAAPLIRRIGFHARSTDDEMDRYLVTTLPTAIIGLVVLAAIVIALLEGEKRSFTGFGSSSY